MWGLGEIKKALDVDYQGLTIGFYCFSDSVGIR
jgi:hypothetical protein